MKKLTAKELKNIRNVIIAASMIGGLIAWFALPAVIKNSSIVHVGTGQFGLKFGVLLVLLFPLFALIPTNGEDVHTEDPTERAAILEERLTKERKTQIAIAILELLVIVLVFALWATHAL